MHQHPITTPQAVAPPSGKVGAAGDADLTSAWGRSLPMLCVGCLSVFSAGCRPMSLCMAGEAGSLVVARACNAEGKKTKITDVSARVWNV